jgi:hypothetical protein
MPDQNKSLGVANSTSYAKSVDFNYISTIVTQAIFVAPWPCIVTHIYGRPRVAGSDGSAVSLSFYKAGDGVAVGSGTLLHSGSYNMKGTADTFQHLTLVTDPTVLTLNKGDAIGFVLTGTATAAVGVINVFVEPLS